MPSSGADSCSQMPPVHWGIIAAHLLAFSNFSTGIPTGNCTWLECPVISPASPQGCVILSREKEHYYLHMMNTFFLKQSHILFRHARDSFYDDIKYTSASY